MLHWIWTFCEYESTYYAYALMQVYCRSFFIFLSSIYYLNCLFFVAINRIESSNRDYCHRKTRMPVSWFWTELLHTLYVCTHRERWSLRARCEHALMVNRVCVVNYDSEKFLRTKNYIQFYTLPYLKLSFIVCWNYIDITYTENNYLILGLSF